MASIGLGGSINKVKDFGKNLADKIMGKAGKYGCILCKAVKTEI